MTLHLALGIDTFDINQTSTPTALEAVSALLGSLLSDSETSEYSAAYVQLSVSLTSIDTILVRTPLACRSTQCHMQDL